LLGMRLLLGLFEWLRLLCELPWLSCLQSLLRH
jgi:hypothetical protein